MTALADSFTWQDAALCRGLPLGVFFGAEGEQSHEKPVREAEAKRVCARCPVRAACLADALDAGLLFGFLAGRPKTSACGCGRTAGAGFRAAERRAS